MVFCEENITNPELLEGDAVDSVMYDDQDFMDQLMGTYSTSDEGILADIEDDKDFDTVIDDDVCGDSIDMLDVEADDYIDSYNNCFDDEDGEIIDKVLGLHPVI